MSQQILNVRVRPVRLAVLISQEADQKDLLLAFKLFSRIWGGRFGQLLSVDPKICDKLTAFRLCESRPEFIYGIGLDDEHWTKETRRVCQPRGYAPLRAEFVENIRRDHIARHIVVDHALVHHIQTRDRKGSRKRAFRLITCDESSAWCLYCAAMFGNHYPNVLPDFFDKDTPFTANTTSAFIELATEFVTEWQQSWLDMTGYELHTRSASFGPLCPTIVLVQSPILDFPLFWNLRTASDAIIPAWIIPIPFDGPPDAVVLERLKDWLLAFQPYGQKPNYCLVTSSSVKEEDCLNFCEQFKNQLSGTQIEFVDYQPPVNRIPVVIPYEYETPWPVEISNRRLTIQPPRSRLFENIGSSEAWFVDLCNDVRTGRAVGELQLPPTPAAYEILNGPCPPTISMQIIPPFGDGSDCINIYCSGNKEVVNIYLPTSEEILGEILREYDVEPIPDEKRSSYVPVLKRFGGIFPAGAAFSGQRGNILTILAGSTKTVAELLGACRLGRGEVEGQNFDQWIEPLLRNQSERMKRIGKRRFLEHNRRTAPESLRLQILLEHWADRKILARKWKIGPCGRCNQTYFVPALNIQRHVICTNCGHRISLLPKVPIGYTLQRAVRHAIEEGIIPVALTGRFLRNMTNHGFFWLPGIKYRSNTKRGDIDILACCDGWLVFCECKNLKSTPTDKIVWDDVVTQFLDTAAIAQKCGGNLAVLAALIEEFPKPVQDRIEIALGTSIPYLLLNKNDLETGHRGGAFHEATKRLDFSDLIPPVFPYPEHKKTDKPRTISMGWGTYSR